MIIFYAQGGLGNQLFQYAAAKIVSIRTNRKVFVDTSWFDHVPRRSTPRDLDLLDLGPQCVKLSFFQVILARVARHRLLRPLAPIYGLNLLDDRHISYLSDPSFLFQSNVYLRGYWQSHDLVKGLKDILKSELGPQLLKFRLHELIGVADLRAELVCIHVRRGDYLMNIKGLSSACPLSYYTKALDFLCSRVKNPVFVVFSDDINWVMKNLPIPGRAYYPELIRPCNSVVSMGLMMQCNHFIISNSTFSWWAAWLGETDSSITVCPSPWIVSGVEVDSLFVPGWLRFSVRQDLF
jgi:hypothetical protein